MAAISITKEEGIMRCGLALFQIRGFIVENDISSKLTADAVLKYAGLDQVFTYKK